MELPERVEVLSDTACEVWEAVSTGGWEPSSAADALGAVDVLVAALARLGPEAAAALEQVPAATAAVRALLTAPGAGPERSGPSGTRGRDREPGRHTVPEFWITRNAMVAEQLWWGEQEGRGGPLADMFAALPPRAMEEAVTRRLDGEVWHQVLEDLTHRHAG
ncbi:hypothetical protein [Streptomyces sp. NPDC020141]|uniref:hypothetical protein n=1 Tax=Streptomyces sp. NPDC020141 TaxID=3365065 RepID=UPI003792E3D8